MGSKAIRPLHGGRSVAASTERWFRLGMEDAQTKTIRPCFSSNLHVLFFLERGIYHGFTMDLIYTFLLSWYIYIYIMDWLYGLSWSHWNPRKNWFPLRSGRGHASPCGLWPDFQEAGTRSTGQLEKNDREGLYKSNHYRLDFTFLNVFLGTVCSVIHIYIYIYIHIYMIILLLLLLLYIYIYTVWSTCIQYIFSPCIREV